MKTLSYNRAAAVAYANKWALDRNPGYYNYERLEGTARITPHNAFTAARGDELPSDKVGIILTVINRPGRAWNFSTTL